MKKYDYYNKIARGYEELYKDEQLKKLDFILKNLPKSIIKKNDLLLDVGCGTGLTTLPWNCKKAGLDPAIKLLKRAKNKKNIFYVNAEAEHIPFKNKSFDMVVSITALQNLHDIEKGIKEIKRVGKNKFILSALQKSSKIEKIKNLVNRNFKVKRILEEDKDLVFAVY